MFPKKINKNSSYRTTGINFLSANPVAQRAKKITQRERVWQTNLSLSLQHLYFPLQV